MNEIIMKMVSSGLYTMTRSVPGVAIRHISGDVSPIYSLVVQEMARTCPICSPTNRTMEWREPRGYTHMTGGADVTCSNCRSTFEVRPAYGLHAYCTVDIFVPAEYADQIDLYCDVI